MAKSKKKKGKKKEIHVEQAVGMGLEDMLQKVRLETLQAIVARVEQDDISYEGAVREAIQDIEAGIEPIVVENVWIPKSNATPQQESYSVAPLAHAFGVSKQTLTKFLRENFPDDAPGVGSSWRVTPEMVDAFARR